MGFAEGAILPGGVPRSDDTDAKVELSPRLALAKKSYTERLPRDPTTGELFGRKTKPRPSDFEFLGLGVYSYIAHLHRMHQFFLLLALLSVSSIIANGYGGELAHRQINIVTWLFTSTSLGNASSVSPSYGSTEFVISTAMTIFLYFALGTLEEDAERVEKKQITPADFTVRISGLALPLALVLTLILTLILTLTLTHNQVMISGLPRDGPAPVRAAINAAVEVAGKHISADNHIVEVAGKPVDGVVVPQHQRELILMQREIESNAKLIKEYKKDADRLKGSGRLSMPGAGRLTKLEKALEAAHATEAKLMAKAKTQVEKLGGTTPPCAGVAFVTFNDANNAVKLLQQESIVLPGLGAAPFKVERPPEPSDVLWENLGCTDATARQLRGTVYMALLSMAGAFLIGASAYLQPAAAKHPDADSPLKQLAVVASGALVQAATPCVQAATLQPAPPGRSPTHPRHDCTARGLPRSLHHGAHRRGSLHEAHHGHVQGGVAGA